MKQEGQPSAEVPSSTGDPPPAGAVSPDRVVAAAADAHTAKPQPTEPATEPRPGSPSPAASDPAPERVDWTAILEERALVPDSEAASPIAEAVVVPGQHGRRRPFLYLIVALTALFSLVASAAVVVALLRDDKAAAPSAADRERDDEVAARPPPQEPPPAPPAEPAAAGAAAGASDPSADRAAAAQAEDETARAGDEKREEAEERARQARSDKGATKGKPDRAAKDGEKRTSASKDDKENEKAGREKGREGEDGEEDGAAAPVASDGARPEKPSIKDLAAAMKPLEPKIHACAKENGVTGTAAIKLEVGADGKIAWAAVREGGGAFQGCVNKVLRAIRLPASENGGTLIHSVSLPDP